MAAPKRRLPAPLYDIGKKIRTRGMSAEDVAWDEYLIPGLDGPVLRNKVGGKNEPYGCTDRDTLIHREERFTAFRMVELQQRPIEGNFDFAHMQAIHRHLFQDVYEWAGEPRTVDLVKEGHDYLSHELVEKMWTQQSAALKKVDGLKGVRDKATFVTNLAAHWGLANATHAFREGNTRSQVVFFAQMAREAGWHIDVARLSPDHPESLREEFIEARYHHQDNQFDPGPLAKVLAQVTTPIETLEQRLERAAAPSVDHERWAPRVPGQPDLMREAIATQTSVVEHDEYTNPDKMRTAHRRIAPQETPVPIDPSRNAQPHASTPDDAVEGVRTVVVGRTRHGMSANRAFQITRLTAQVDEYLELNNHLQGIDDPAELADKLAFVWVRANVIHKDDPASQIAFIGEVAARAGWDLDAARFSPEHPDSLYEAFSEAHQHMQTNSNDHAPLAAVLNGMVTPAEEDTRSVELQADLEADLAEEPVRLAREAAREERFRRFPELRPVPMPHTPGTGRHRATSSPEL